MSRIPNRPLARPKPAKKTSPLTTAVMRRIREIMEQGNHTQRELATAVGSNQQRIAEYLGGYRSAPNAETMTSLILWATARDRTFPTFLKGMAAEAHPKK